MTDGGRAEARDSAEGRRLADVGTGDLRRSLGSAAVLAGVLALFLWMVGSVLLAAFLGAVVAVFLRPLAERMEGWMGRPGPAAALALGVPALVVVAILGYGYSEIHAAAEYVQQNQQEIARRVGEALSRLPFVGEVGGEGGGVASGVGALARWGTSLPSNLQSTLAGFTVAMSIFLFTAFYLLTDADTVVDYLRVSVPDRYASLAEELERNVTAVLRGTILAVFVTQAMKAAVILGLNLTLGVPLPFTLAVLAFVVGLFPVLGSWAVYVPAAGYLLVFENAPVRAALMVGLGFTVSTVLLSLWLRPRIASQRSHVLSFYWMFLGLVAGVYAFGPAGLILGPVIIAVLKGALDTVRTPPEKEPPGARDEDAPEAEVMAEEELEGASP